MNALFRAFACHFFFIQMNFGDEDKGCEVCGVGWGFTVVVVSDVQYLIMKPHVTAAFIHSPIHPCLSCYFNLLY